MFSRVAAFFVLALPILATASELEARDTCNTGPVQCCTNLADSSSTNLGEALGGGLLGINIAAIVGSVTGLVGVGCLPLSVIGLSGNSCSQQPVCCTNNYGFGAIQFGCSPVNVNL
ncbi:hypothetical protein GALMADRAFT_140196 [Galerina marginata CBS 339.88]|uniref:Hydrophobin n=1 Tax=Galerina marginata (strain CBS 339.88) TaxID=685588 RepID=A0A067SZS5_GALM3|nr:hypothetical protein GALMADRAFT_140196 [Galerina marginata CBS 339.88]